MVIVSQLVKLKYLQIKLYDHNTKAPLLTPPKKDFILLFQKKKFFLMGQIFQGSLGNRYNILTPVVASLFPSWGGTFSLSLVP